MKNRMYEIAKEVGNWYGTFYEESNIMYIDNNCVTYSYATAEELLQDWIHTMLEDENNIWNDELKFLLSEGLKVTGIRVVDGKNDSTFMASIDYPIDKKKTRNLSVGTYKLVKEAFIARHAAVMLRKECLDLNKDIDEFKKDLKELKDTLSDKNVMRELCYTPFHNTSN